MSTTKEYKIGRFRKCLTDLRMAEDMVAVVISHYKKDWSRVSFFQTSLWFDCPGVSYFARIDREFEYRNECLGAAMQLGKKLGLPVYICKVADGSEILQQLSAKKNPTEKDEKRMLDFVRGKYPYNTSTTYIVEKAKVTE